MLRLVSVHIGNRLGLSPQFAAIFSPGALHSAGDRGSLTEPFASLALTVLRSIGGQYLEIADKLEQNLVDTWAQGLSGPPLPAARLSLTSENPGPVTHDRIPTISTGGLMGPETTVARPVALWRGVPPKNPNFTGERICSWRCAAR